MITNAQRERLPVADLDRLAAWADELMASRSPDYVIGPRDDPQLERWFVVPRNPLANVYLHRFRRSDPAVPHDHPWDNRSVILRGEYLEQRPTLLIEGEWIMYNEVYRAGDVIEREAEEAHVIRLRKDSPPIVSLFLTGPVRREWGFHCPRGWVPAERFIKRYAGGNERGAGCGE